ncbi:MAG: hypothetical protein IJS22_05015 [Lachnospiraceae bacterium]|nr:hypothetical protein [Lachnospiraceae bacterium]
MEKMESWKFLNFPIFPHDFPFFPHIKKPGISALLPDEATVMKSPGEKRSIIFV